MRPERPARRPQILPEPPALASPDALLGKFGCFRVISTTAEGALLEWGFQPPLLVPPAEQKDRMVPSESYLVRVGRDEKTGRFVGSARADRSIAETAPHAKEHAVVDLLIVKQTDMGYKAVVDGSYWGLLYKNEVFQPLRRGDRIQGFIARVREDGKVDLSLQRSGYKPVPDLSGKILAHVRSQGGSAPLSDRTPPEEIHRIFGVSKKKFKMAIGFLYKKRLIVIEKNSIRFPRDGRPSSLPARGPEQHARRAPLYQQGSAPRPHARPGFSGASSRRPARPGTAALRSSRSSGRTIRTASY